jgi:hemolysin III
VSRGRELRTPVRQLPRAMAGTAVAVPVKPLMRGMFHQVAFVLAVPATLLLVLQAHTPRARVAATVYGLGLCALYGVSSSYHRFGWSAAARLRMRRADHGTIFLMIAGTYTPLCLVLLHGAVATSLLIAAWLGALSGFTLAVAGISERSKIEFPLYLVLGWLAAVAIPQIASRTSTLDLGLFLGGGLVYTVGAFILASHWPDPSPRLFGYHEVWHSLVIAASVCHYLVILSLVRAG